MPNGQRRYGDLPWQGAEDWFQRMWGGLWGQPTGQAAGQPIAELTERTRQIMGTPAYQEQERRRLEGQLGLPGQAPAQEPAGMPTQFGAATFPAEKAPEGYDWRWDSASMRYVLTPRPGAARISQAEIRRIELAEEEAERQQAQWEQQQAWQREQAEMQQQWQQQQLEAERQWREEQIAWQREEAERVERARLSAQPQSWLQYASYTGETPGIQPWMLPLMPQQYQQLGAGGAIPGWTPEGGAGMPELARPSRQLQARMGPTALAQYGGYQQARTGIRPEEQAWRMGATAPPGGGRRGLQYAR